MLKIIVDKAAEDAARPSIGMSASSTGKMPPMLTSVKRPKRHETHSSSGVVVKGLDDVLVRLSRCCNPVPGDEIIGYITRGRGVSIHKANCANIRHAEPERRVPVSWAENGPTGTFCVAIKILANDRVGLMADITSFLAGMGVSIRNISTSVNARRDANIRLVLEVRSREQVDTVLEEALVSKPHPLPAEKKSEAKAEVPVLPGEGLQSPELRA
jgi:GTP pyrophosphokinase